MSTKLTVTQVAKLAKRSKSSVHRDIEKGRLEIIEAVPGYNGAFLVDESEARRYVEAMEPTA